MRRAAALLVLVGPLLAADGPGSRPNFVVILAEAQSWAGSSVTMDDRLPKARDPAVSTPAVERLAREGVRFARGYAASPRCTPSRAALLTGRSPAALHMTYVGAGRREAQGTVLLPPTPVLELPAAETTVAEILRPAGYATAHFGKWHLGRVRPEEHGFDASDGPTGNGGPDNVADPNPEQARGMTARGIAFIEQALRSGRPFYVQLSHYPNQGEKARRRDGVGGETAVVDATVGALLDALDRLGVAANTYVLYTSDHGAPGRGANAPLSGGKGAVTEGGLRVPFLVRGPGVPAGRVVRVPVTAMDVLPTIIEWSGVRTDRLAGVEGGSFAGLLRQPATATAVQRAREELVFHFPHYDLGNGGPATAMILGDWKLVRNYETKRRRLFDLARDPGESRDLAADREETVRELDARLDRYLADVRAALPQPNPDPAATAAPAEGNGSGRDARGGRGRNRRE